MYIKFCWEGCCLFQVLLSFANFIPLDKVLNIICQKMTCRDSAGIATDFMHMGPKCFWTPSYILIITSFGALRGNQFIQVWKFPSWKTTHTENKQKVPPNATEMGSLWPPPNVSRALAKAMSLSYASPRPSLENLNKQNQVYTSWWASLTIKSYPSIFATEINRQFHGPKRN